MKSKKRFSHYIIYLLLAIGLGGFLVTKNLFDAGELGPVFNHPLLGCKTFSNVTGAEDMTTVDDGRTTLISVHDRHDLSEKKVPAGIYRYSGDSEPSLLMATEGNPHGITSYPTVWGSRVYVVMHRMGEDDSVDIFDWASGTQTLTFVKKIKFEGVRTLNAVVALSENQVFVSQDLQFEPGPLQEVEKALRLPLGKVWFLDSEDEKPFIVREDILYANGLAVSPDKKHLFVASTTGRSLIDFDLSFNDAKRPELKWQREWPLKTAPDNLKWDNDRLLIGSHRKLITLLMHSFDARRFRAPSQLIAIKGLPEAVEIEELHSTKSHGVEGVSVGVVSNDRIVMGGVWSEGILDCALDKSPISSPSTGTLVPTEIAPTELAP